MKLVGRYAITILALLASVILVMLSIQLWQHDRSARELKAAWLRRKHPGWSEEAIDVAVRKAFAHAGD